MSRHGSLLEDSHRLRAALAKLVEADPLGLIDDLHGYARQDWAWKYGESWHQWAEKVRAALAEAKEAMQP